MHPSITSQNSHHATTGALGHLVRLTEYIGLVYIYGLLGLSAQHIVFPQRNGLLALTQVFAPYLFVPLLVFLLALRRGSFWLRVGIGLCLLIAAIRFLPTWISLPPFETPDAPRLSAATWNLYVTNHNLDELRQTVLAAQPDILAVQELTEAHQTVLADDPELARQYPWQYLEANTADGMGILSRYPIVEQGILRNPNRAESFPTLWARVDLGNGRTLMVVTAHARAPRTPFHRPLPFPRGFDSTGRDADIAFLRHFIDPFLENNQPLLLLGDFNLTEREPAYREASAGLIDAHQAVGNGSGNTWILSPLRWLNLGLLRIDYLFSSPRVTPLRTSVDCAGSSDHCLVYGLFEIN